MQYREDHMDKNENKSSYITPLSFLVTLNLPNLSRLTNDPIFNHSAWPMIPAKLSSYIPQFEGKPGENPTNHVITFLTLLTSGEPSFHPIHLWCSSNSLLDDSINLCIFQQNLNRGSYKVVN